MLALEMPLGESINCGVKPVGGPPTVIIGGDCGLIHASLAVGSRVLLFTPPPGAASTRPGLHDTSWVNGIFCPKGPVMAFGKARLTAVEAARV